MTVGVADELSSVGNETWKLGVSEVFRVIETRQQDFYSQDSAVQEMDDDEVFDSRSARWGEVLD
jgi:hypothetical protein